MNVSIVDNQAETRTETEQTCLWKQVLTSNLNGEGTSFDPSNLTLPAFRCLGCDGSDSECLRYIA